MVPRDQLDAVQFRLDQVTARLVDAYRQLFLRLPEAERPVFLIDLIKSGRIAEGNEAGSGSRPPLPHSVRELAYDLANAEVVSARPLGPAFVEAAAIGLTDPRPSIRAKAASLLAKLDADPILDQVVTALHREQNTEAAVAMLSVVVRHPSPLAREVVFERICPEGQPIPVIAAALDAVLALNSAQPAEDPGELGKIRGAIDALGPDHITPNAVRLLARIGELETVRGYVSSSNAPISRAAAQSLVSDPQSLDAIVEQARQASALYEFAAEAVRNHQANAAGYARIAGLPAPSAEKRDEVLVRLAGALPPAELLQVVSMPMDLAERERLLSTIATPAELEKLAGEDYRTEDRRLLLESLVRTRLQLKNAAGALRVVESLPAEVKSSALAQDEIEALVWLNRLDDAVARTEAIGPPRGPGVWLATLERIESLDHAPAVLARCAELYEAGFTPEQREQFLRLAERVASLHGSEDDPADPSASDQTVAGEDGNSDDTPSESEDTDREQDGR